MIAVNVNRGVKEGIDVNTGPLVNILGFGKCHLKTRKDGEPAYVRKYGPVYPGNNYIYVSGSKYCTHVSISFSTSYPRLFM